VERRAPDQATRLSFADGQCCVKQDDREVRISIEDLAWAVIDTPQATLASALMAEGWQSFNRGPPRDGGSKNLLPKGSVRTLQVTDRQYARMKLLLGEASFSEKKGAAPAGSPLISA
jgi:hypothetical protein